MDREEKKKVLFLIGMEQSIEDFIDGETSKDKNILILQSYQSTITQPFDDLMRDILIAVYQENVEEIFVVAPKNSEQKAVNIYSKIVETKGLHELKTLDYLFAKSMPEFQAENIRGWIEGIATVKDRVQKTVNMIKDHPLMRSGVKVKALWNDYGNQSENRAI